MPGQSGAVVGMIGGAALLIVLADVAPRLVIGLLVLILAGIVLKNGERYTAVIAKVTGQQSGK